MPHRMAAGAVDGALSQQWQPVVQIYGPLTTDRRGGTIAFNFLTPKGNLLDCYQAQAKINHLSISLRSGCFCNPGVREVALGFTKERLASCFRGKERMTYEQFLQVIEWAQDGCPARFGWTGNDVWRCLSVSTGCPDLY